FDLLLDFLATHPDTAGRPPVMMFNHPDNTLNPLPKEYGADDFSSAAEFVKRMGAQTSLIQMINGPSHKDGSNNPPSSPDELAFLKYLRMGFKLAPTADQDNHLRNWGSATPARTAIIAPSLTKANLLDALRRRPVYATEYNNLKVVTKF